MESSCVEDDEFIEINSHLKTPFTESLNVKRCMQVLNLGKMEIKDNFWEKDSFKHGVTPFDWTGYVHTLKKLMRTAISQNGRMKQEYKYAAERADAGVASAQAFVAVLAACAVLFEATGAAQVDGARAIWADSLAGLPKVLVDRMEAVVSNAGDAGAPAAGAVAPKPAKRRRSGAC